MWSRVIEALEPLVQHSREHPVTDWNHERCIIRLVNAHLKIGNRTEATKIFESTKAAYRDRDASLQIFASDDLIYQQNKEILEDTKDTMSRQALTEPGPPWQIFVKTLTTRTMTINASPNMLVDDVMHELEAREGSPYHYWAGYGRLIFGGKQLELHRILTDYGIQSGSTLHYIPRLLGGNP